MKFYTYAHFRPNGQIFYIGKGSNLRAWTTRRNAYWKQIVKKNKGFEVKILSYWKTEEEAFEHEKFLISCLKNINIKLANLTNGGEGRSGSILSNETKRKMSMAKIGKKKTLQHCENIKKAKLGIVMPKETKEKISKKLSIGIVKATNLETKKVSFFRGKNELVKAGFKPPNVSACIKGKLNKHKNHVFERIL